MQTVHYIKDRGLVVDSHLWSEDSKRRPKECTKDSWTASDPCPANSGSHQSGSTHVCLQQHEWNEHYACLRVREEWLYDPTTDSTTKLGLVTEYTLSALFIPNLSPIQING